MTEQILSALRPDRVYVYGVATEYCVLRAVLGLRRCGYDATVVSDAVRPVDEEAGRAAVAHMRAGGAHMARTAEVIKELG